MKEAGFFGGSIGMTGDHRLVPLLDFFRRTHRAVLLHPGQDFIIAVQSIRRFFERVAIQFEKGEQMLIEANGLVIVSLEPALPMEARFVD